MTLALTIIFGITTIVGLIVSIYYGRRTAHLEAKLRSFDWDDVRIGATELAGRLKGSFEPQLIFAVSLRGAMIAYFLTDVLRTPPPVVVGMQAWTDDAQTPVELEGFELLATHRSTVQIPRALYDLDDRRLLIVDDLAFSGDALVALKERMAGAGFDLRTLTLAATQVAITNQKAPDYYWRAADSSHFFFPWGRAR